MEFSEITFLSGVYAPIICAFLAFLFSKILGEFAVKCVAFLGFAIALLSSLITAIFYAESGSIEVSSIFGVMGVNGISQAMYLLSGIVGFSAFLWTIVSPVKIKGLSTYLICMLFMQGGLMGMFASQNIIWIYAFHEFALVPTFIAMCIWGGENRKSAAMEMAIYLTFGALLALIGIIALAFISTRTLTFNLTELTAAFASANIDLNSASLIFAVLAIGLGILVSLFPLHSWAPKTYNEAPTAFSMLHAGVLKKFGLYLLISVVVPLLGKNAGASMSVITVLAILNIVLIGLCTMAQNDFKMMVSYSSVSHMGLCFLGIATMSVLGAGGAILIMFGHGLSVAALFIFAEIIKNRFSTCDMTKLGGAYKNMPVCAGLFIAAILANIGLPGFANFWGELSVFVSLWNKGFVVCALAVSGIIISAIYGLRAVANIFFGNQSNVVKKIENCDVSWKERSPILILLIALILIGFAPKLITNPLSNTLENIPTYNLTDKSAK